MHDFSRSYQQQGCTFDYVLCRLVHQWQAVGIFTTHEQQFGGYQIRAQSASRRTNTSSQNSNSLSKNIYRNRSQHLFSTMIIPVLQRNLNYTIYYKTTYNFARMFLTLSKSTRRRRHSKHRANNCLCCACCWSRSLLRMAAHLHKSVRAFVATYLYASY